MDRTLACLLLGPQDLCVTVRDGEGDLSRVDKRWRMNDGYAYASLRFARVVLLSFGFDLFKAACFLAAFARSISLWLPPGCGGQVYQPILEGPWTKTYGSCWRAGNVTTATIAICRRERSSQRTGQPRLPNMRKYDYEPFAVRCSGTGSMRGRYMYSIKLASEREVETSDGLHQVALNSRNAAITAS
ncbi:hypothetical protein PISMIDRAFT_179794 [Pisolithus microcarpus 441]|uniref:Uncharacterized protein n=1 Tax=Pisolithus microcarpus 441 TaxID=765257 RepID=A0A0C9Z8D8_9AGAM|nr:hypothetical protein PISMIDRAFT_179794 [Pisolithus microcarpus 441]